MMKSRIALSAGALATSGLLLFSSAALAAGQGHGGNNGAGAGRETPAPAGTTDYHNGNRGDVWMEEGSGETTPSRGHENDTHFACNTPLNIMGDKMGDSAGYFSIVPQGGNGGPSTYSGTWSYGAQGGNQVIARVPAGALLPGHYKLDLTQDPQKHKVFWIDDCATSGTAAGTGATTGNGTGGSTEMTERSETETVTINGERVTLTLVASATMAEFESIETELSKLEVGETETIQSLVVTRTGASAFTITLATSAATVTTPQGAATLPTTAGTGSSAPAPTTSTTASTAPAANGGVLAETAHLPLVGGAIGAVATGAGAVLAETGTPIGFLILGILLIVVGTALFARRRRTVL